MPKKVIKVRGLVKHYGKVTALQGISFEVFQGEVFSLVGPNGAGKTTTVEILECLRVPSAGEVEVLDLNVMREQQRVKERIGVMPQEFNAFERLTVKENISLISKIHGKSDNVRGVLERFGLWELRDRKFGELSGGNKRRVGVAMALVSDPEIVFLDEPTTGLDPQARRELWKNILELKKMGVTVFLTTHYMEEVEALADRVGLLVNGRLLAVGSVKALISRYGGGFKIHTRLNRKLTRSLEKLSPKVEKKRNSLVATFESKQKLGRALAHVYSLGLDARVYEPSMNEVFLNLVGGRINDRGELVK